MEKEPAGESAREWTTEPDPWYSPIPPWQDAKSQEEQAQEKDKKEMAQRRREAQHDKRRRKSLAEDARDEDDVSPPRLVTESDDDLGTARVATPRADAGDEAAGGTSGKEEGRVRGPLLVRDDGEGMGDGAVSEDASTTHTPSIQPADPPDSNTTSPPLRDPAATDEASGGPETTAPTVTCEKEAPRQYDLRERDEDSKTVLPIASRRQFFRRRGGLW
jgi:hypothetical protein